MNWYIRIKLAMPLPEAKDYPQPWGDINYSEEDPEQFQFLRYNTDTIEEIDDLTDQELVDLFEVDEHRQSKDDRLSYFHDKFYSNIPSSICPFCNFEKITKGDIVQYMIKTIVEEKIIKEIKEKFSSYEEFKDFLSKEDNDEN